MKSFVLIAFIINGCFFLSAAQKKNIDTSVLNRWPYIYTASLSNNGAYALYAVQNVPYNQNTLTVVSTKGNLKVKFVGIKAQEFTEDSKKVVFLNRNDSLCIYNLENEKLICFSKVENYSLISKPDFSYVVFKSDSTVTVFDLLNNDSKSFNGVMDYRLCGDRYLITVRSTTNVNGHIVTELSYIDMRSLVKKNIFSAPEISELTLDDANTKVAFLVKTDKERSIWAFNLLDGQLSMLINDSVLSQAYPKKSIVNILSTGFSNDGGVLFFEANEVSDLERKHYPVKVDVWSYSDEKLQSQQLYEMRGVSLINSYKNSFVYSINTANNKILCLKEKGADIQFLDNKEKFAIVFKQGGDYNERKWNSASYSNLFIISTSDGKKSELGNRDIGMPVFKVSDKGNYLIWIDSSENILLYDISTGVTKSITQLIKKHFQLKPENEERYLFDGWCDDENGPMYVRNSRDIWYINPLRNSVTSVTSNLGKKNNIVFDIVKEFKSNDNVNDRLILHSFDNKTKEEGFYSFEKKVKRLEMLSAPSSNKYSNIIRARDKDIYLVYKENSAESVNVYLTKDFKDFVLLSDNFPEANYNWFKSELINWKGLDGNLIQGVLYKPDSFNDKNKYPVIIHYYENKSDDLNKYLRPEFITGGINIPYFLAQGYLIVTPDIKIKNGAPGQSSLNSVLSVANYISTFSFVDGKKIGIQGHSFGGYETNYIITHTNRFAAAVSGSGAANLISLFGSLHERGLTKNTIVETGQYKVSCPPWTNPDLYVRNSPIFFVKQVSTPILLMNNIKDGAVPFAQGFEFFSALRRLGKKAWLLQYDDSKHSLSGRDAIDYTVRITQFFNHYLKSMSAPKWMTQGVPAIMKGKLSGLEMDND